MSFKKIKNYASQHKIITGIGAVIILFVVYWAYGKATSTAGETRYVLASAQKGTIIASITGSGQVSASNQIDLKPKVSGDIIYVGAVDGQQVKAGDLIAQIDSQDAQKAVRDAETSLESSKISLQKLQQPADELSLTQAENALADAQQAKQKDEDNLKKSYDDAFTAISNAFLDLPNTISGVQDILYKNSFSLNQDNISYYADLVKNWDSNVLSYKDSAAGDYQTARAAYDKNFLDYKSANRYSDNASIETLLGETYDTTKSIAQSIKSADNLLSFVKDRLAEHNAVIPSQLATQQTSTATYTNSTNTNLTALFNAKNAIKNYKDALASDELTIKEKSQSLDKLKNGADPLDVQSSQLAVKQKENALLDAQEKLADYYIRAPFDGTIGKMDVNQHDSATSATIIATLITKQKIAELSLNEIDAAKIKAGQKATLTFDAIDGLSISGEVSEIDTIGTVTQGVVTYNVKIGFDTQDDRVKPGMSTSAAIITDVKQDVLVAPNSAVKTQGNNKYVEVFNPPLNSQGQGNQGVASTIAPIQQAVETGLSSDTQTEIISGLKEGDQIVVRTITPSTAAATTAPSLLGGGRNTGAGALRGR